MASADAIDLQHIVAWLIEQHEAFVRSGESGSLTWEMHYQNGALRTVDFGARHRLWEQRERRKKPQQ